MILNIKNTMIRYLCITAILFLLLSSCNTNDYQIEYQKDQLYDGYKTPIDTVLIETYHAVDINGSLQKKDLQSKAVRWYDLNGYHSMTKSWVYSDNGVTFTLEKLIRDKHSLVTAKDISIEAPNTVPVVILSRLKKRKNGVEEWLYRHYFTPEKFLEDKLTIYYTENSKIIKKPIAETDSLIIVEIDEFDMSNRLVQKTPGGSSSEQPFLSFKYAENDLLDVSTTSYFKENDSTQSPQKAITETYKYDLDSLGNQMKKYTFRNDSLVFITEYQYGFRK